MYNRFSSEAYNNLMDIRLNKSEYNGDTEVWDCIDELVSWISTPEGSEFWASYDCVRDLDEDFWQAMQKIGLHFNEPRLPYPVEFEIPKFLDEKYKELFT